MAIIFCPECKKEVSDQAASCPHCGFPLHQSNNEQSKSNIESTNKAKMESTSSDKKIVKAIIGIGFIIVGITCCLTDNILAGICFLAASVSSFIDASK